MGADKSNGKTTWLDRIKGMFQRRGPVSPKQRRLHVRFPTPGHDVTIWVGRERFKGIVKDVSASGLRIESSRPIPGGALISVRLEGSDCEYPTVQARSSWCRPAVGRFEAGIGFLDRREVVERSFVMPLLQEAGEGTAVSDERRQTRRIRTNARAVLHSSASIGRSTATLLDISEGGALIKTGRWLDRGVYLRVATESIAGCPGVDLEARVLRVGRKADGSFHVNLQFVSPTPAEQKRLLVHLNFLAA